MPQKDTPAEKSCKIEWSEAHREAFTFKLHKLGWEYGEHYFSREGYQKGLSRLEIDSGGCWLWEYFCNDGVANQWHRTHGLCDMDVDLIKGDVLGFVEGMKVKRFDLAKGEWV